MMPQRAPVYAGVPPDAGRSGRRLGTGRFRSRPGARGAVVGDLRPDADGVPVPASRRSPVVVRCPTGARELQIASTRHNGPMNRWRGVAPWLAGAVVLVAVLVLLAGRKRWRRGGRTRAPARPRAGRHGGGRRGRQRVVERRGRKSRRAGGARAGDRALRTPPRRHPRRGLPRPGSTTSRSWRRASATPDCPPPACDAIFQRRVYHHLTDPAATNASLYAALKPGGPPGHHRAGVQRPLRFPPGMASLDRRRAGGCGGHGGGIHARRDRRLAVGRPLRRGVPEVARVRRAGHGHALRPPPSAARDRRLRRDDPALHSGLRGNDRDRGPRDRGRRRAARRRGSLAGRGTRARPRRRNRGAGRRPSSPTRTSGPSP